MADTFNRNCASLHNRLLVMDYEVAHMNSANVTAWEPEDVARLDSYIVEAKAYMGFVQSEPKTDEPEHSPQRITMKDFPELDVRENPTLNDVRRLLRTIAAENMNGQSSRRSSQWLGFDYDRIIALFNKLQGFLVDFIAKQQPLDRPKSTPAELMAPEGRRGTAGAGNS